MGYHLELPLHMLCQSIDSNGENPPSSGPRHGCQNWFLKCFKGKNTRDVQGFLPTKMANIMKNSFQPSTYGKFCQKPATNNPKLWKPSGTNQPQTTHPFHPKSSTAPVPSRSALQWAFLRELNHHHHPPGVKVRGPEVQIFFPPLNNPIKRWKSCKSH